MKDLRFLSSSLDDEMRSIKEIEANIESKHAHNITSTCLAVSVTVYKSTGTTERKSIAKTSQERQTNRGRERERAHGRTVSKQEEFH